MDRDLYLIFMAKGLRTFVFGLVSVLLPLYLAALGYPVPYVTLGVFLIVLGNVTLNLLLASYEARLGKRGFLVLYSLLMAASGVTLELSRSMYVIASALLLSGMSTTGTETGPFQSVEVSVIPKSPRPLSSCPPSTVNEVEDSKLIPSQSGVSEEAGLKVYDFPRPWSCLFYGCHYVIGPNEQSASLLYRVLFLYALAGQPP